MSLPDRSSSWLVVVNPNAGKRKGEKDWDRIKELLIRKKLDFSESFTASRGHAVKLVKRGIEAGYRNIIAIGGDGTMNEVVNGCFRQKICPAHELRLAMITIGTGNDWGRMFGIPLDYSEAIDVIRNGKTCLHDTGVVHYYNGTFRKKRYFINIAGLGFDAIVVRRTNLQKDRGRSGKAIYFWNLLRSLMMYKHTKTEIEIDGQHISDDVFTISLGIGKYSGGGMMQTPNAVHDDGLFDITVIKKMRKGEIIRNLKLLYDGTILSHPKIEGYTGKEISITSDPIIHVEADGESLGHSPIKFQILPRSIKVVYGNLPETKDYLT
jgi:YegS/Rv2252/BmrU family lipid kinase